MIFTTGMNEPLTHPTKMILYDEFTSEKLNSQGQLRLKSNFIKTYVFLFFCDFLLFSEF